MRSVESRRLSDTPAKLSRKGQATLCCFTRDRVASTHHARFPRSAVKQRPAAARCPWCLFDQDEPTAGAFACSSSRRCGEHRLDAASDLDGAPLRSPEGRSVAESRIGRKA